MLPENTIQYPNDKHIQKSKKKKKKNLTKVTVSGSYPKMETQSPYIKSRAKHEAQYEFNDQENKT